MNIYLLLPGDLLYMIVSFMREGKTTSGSSSFQNLSTTCRLHSLTKSVNAQSSS